MVLQSLLPDKALYLHLSQAAVFLPVTEMVGKHDFRERRTDPPHHLLPDKPYIAARINCDSKELEGFLAWDDNKTELFSFLSHEEADTRLFLHMADAVKKGYRTLLVRTVDTDVVVVAIATLNRTMPDELWVSFGTGGHFRFILIHDVAAAVGPRKSATLPLFHALTGCDTVSSFVGIGKKTAWAAWNVYPEVT